VAPITLAGHAYHALRIDGDDSVSIDPFVALFSGLKVPPPKMGVWTLVLAGTTFPNGAGLVLFAARADPATMNAQMDFTSIGLANPSRRSNITGGTADLPCLRIDARNLQGHLNSSVETSMFETSVSTRWRNATVSRPATLRRKVTSA